MSEQVLTKYHAANRAIESGILAELDGKPAPDKFKEALELLHATSNALGYLREQQAELLAFHEETVSKKGMRVDRYELALGKVLAELGPVERPSAQGMRYSGAGGLKRHKAAGFETIDDILKAQLEDIKTIHRKSEVVIDALRSAIPLADRGEFVPVMLSGRNAFGDVMPQFTDMMSAFERFYIQACMATIAATMQAYPAGWEWLEQR